MKKVEEITEDEMVQVFLKSEMGSDRWKSNIFCTLLKDKKDTSIILNPKLNNIDENNYRRILLGYRGYPDNYLFKGFPKDVKWFWATLTYEDLLEVKVIREENWLQMSSNTRLAKEVARNIECDLLNQREVFHSIRNVTQLIKDGLELPEIILVGDRQGSNLVVLEGHVRLVSYILAGIREKK